MEKVVLTAIARRMHADTGRRRCKQLNACGRNAACQLHSRAELARSWIVFVHRHHNCTPAAPPYLADQFGDAGNVCNPAEITS